MDLFTQMTERIIKEQELIIGPLAWEEARKVKGLVIDGSSVEVSVSDQKPEVVDRLVQQYQRLFGRASVEVCKEAVKDLVYDLSGDQIPSLLK